MEQSDSSGIIQRNIYELKQVRFLTTYITTRFWLTGRGQSAYE